ncbi:formyltransferase family protein [Roseibium sp. Sym1]|uniref:formyltransferase family protein n=1 Tax=Roseibium sp. Sym1 TaxID=3016006 RepID=UPI0022B3A651|nr:formyltransferase family protein [Roseibium sp. Sym1]
MVTDTEGWFDPFARKLVECIRENGDEANFVRDQDKVPEGEVAFYLSCLKLTPDAILARNKVNLVVHASALPKGRGFSPVVWQILEGLDEIPLTLFEMDGSADTGPIVQQSSISFEGHELNDEIRDALGRSIVDICLSYLKTDERPVAVEQTGDPTWYRRRKPADSELDPNKTLAEQFQLLRVVDNERYPAFFTIKGQKYTLKIEKAD